MLEVTILATVFLFIFGAVLRYGLKTNLQQETTMEANRLALARASQASVSGTFQTYTYQNIRDVGIPDPANPLGISALEEVMAAAQSQRTADMYQSRKDAAPDDMERIVYRTPSSGEVTLKTEGYACLDPFIGNDRDGGYQVVKLVQDPQDKLQPRGVLWSWIKITCPNLTIEHGSYSLATTQKISSIDGNILPQVLRKLQSFFPGSDADLVSSTCAPPQDYVGYIANFAGDSQFTSAVSAQDMTSLHSRTNDLWETGAYSLKHRFLYEEYDAAQHAATGYCAAPTGMTDTEINDYLRNYYASQGAGSVYTAKLAAVNSEITRLQGLTDSAFSDNIFENLDESLVNLGLDPTCLQRDDCLNEVITPDDLFKSVKEQSILTANDQVYFENIAGAIGTGGTQDTINSETADILESDPEYQMNVIKLVNMTGGVESASWGSLLANCMMAETWLGGMIGSTSGCSVYEGVTSVGGVYVSSSIWGDIDLTAVKKVNGKKTDKNVKAQGLTGDFKTRTEIEKAELVNTMADGLPGTKTLVKQKDILERTIKLNPYRRSTTPPANCKMSGANDCVIYSNRTISNDTGSELYKWGTSEHN